MAIAFGAFTDGTTNTSYSVTTAGDDRLLIVNVRGDTTDTGASVTYNGVSMTQFNKLEIPGDRWMYAFYLFNPATGSNTVAITGTVNRTVAAYYTGVGSYETSSTNTGTATSLTTSVTTTADNCWLIGVADKVSPGTLVAGTNTTSRGASSNDNIIDTNAAQTPAGSHSMQMTSDSTISIAMIVGSFAPVATVNTTNFFQMM